MDQTIDSETNAQYTLGTVPTTKDKKPATFFSKSEESQPRQESSQVNKSFSFTARTECSGRFLTPWSKRNEIILPKRALEVPFTKSLESVLSSKNLTYDSNDAPGSSSLDISPSYEYHTPSEAGTIFQSEVKKKRTARRARNPNRKFRRAPSGAPRKSSSSSEGGTDSDFTPPAKPNKRRNRHLPSVFRRKSELKESSLSSCDYLSYTSPESPRSESGTPGSSQISLNNNVFSQAEYLYYRLAWSKRKDRTKNPHRKVHGSKLNKTFTSKSLNNSQHVFELFEPYEACSPVISN